MIETEDRERILEIAKTSSTEDVQSIVDSRSIRTFRRLLGETFLNALDHPDTTDLTINSLGKIMVKQNGIYEEIGSVTASNARQIIYEIAALLNVGGHINNKAPIFAGNFPLDGSRMQIVLPPAADNPVLILRTRSRKSFTLEELVEKDVLTANQARVVIDAVFENKKIVVSGSTGSGKTTFCNAIFHEYAKYPERRIIILEDEKELQPQSTNIERFYAKRGFGRHPDIMMHDLVLITLRADPTVIVMGELRDGKAAAELFKAWNTGHPGFCTYHADSALDSLYRFEDLIEEGGIPPKSKRISRTLGLLIHLTEISPGVRRVTELAEVMRPNGDEYNLHFIS